VSLLPDDIKSLLRKYSVRPRKEKGQSFLKSNNIANRIVTSAEISDSDRVLEIGGGLGILTSRIAEVAGYVTVIELEKGLVQALRDILAGRDNVEIIHGDALRVDLPEVDKVVANLPYSISSEMLFRILTESTFESGVLMFQKEFSDRLFAEPGNPIYSRLTIDFQYLGQASHVMDVGAMNFYPVPAVDSSILKITKRNTGLFAKSSDVFFWMVHGLYSYPNKQLRKALKIWFKNLKTPELVQDILSELDDIDETSRLRALSQETLIRLSDVINGFVESGELTGPKGDTS
jgi:16S rRNA (adenine1518-N6/adenine1519-N6)-dimethyltransferase